MAITFLDEEEDIVATAEPTKGKSRITFLDEEEPVTPSVEPATTPATKPPKITFLDEEPQTPSVGGLTIPPAPEVPKFEARKPEEGILRPVADPFLNIGAGINDVVKGFTDAFGADNPVSRNLAKNSEWYRGLLSAGAKQDQEEIGRIMQEAEGQGVLTEIGAGLKALSVAPIDLVSQGIGSLIPFIATAGVGKAVGLSKAGIAVLQGVQGGVVGGGIVKGEIYDAVKDQLINSGVDEGKAEKAAQEAQAYNGKNLDQIFLGVGLGVAASTTGADSAIRSLISRKVGKEAAEAVSEQAIQEVLRTGFVRGAIKDGAVEFATEALQGGQERLAANVAVGREGFDVEPMRGVVGQAVLEGALGGILGGGAGGISAKVSQMDARQKVALRDAQKAAEEAKQSNAPASAAAVEEQVNQTIEETPDEKVARLQREAQEAAGDIELEEEVPVSGLPPVEPTPPVTPTPEAAVAPVEPSIPEVVVEPPEGVGIAPPPPRQEFTDLINEGETSDDAYQRYQSQIDEIEDRLETEGVDIVKLVDPTMAGAQNLIGQEGYTEMPPDLVEAYARREAVGAGQLAQSVGELTEVLKNQNISEQDIKRVLDTYAIDVGKVDAFAQYKANEYTKAKVEAPPITQLERVAIALAAERGEMFDAVEDISKETLLDAGRAVKAIQDYFGVRPTEQQRNEFSRVSGVEFAALPPAPEAAVTPPPVEPPALAPLRRVVKAEQTEDDVSGLVGQGLVELYNGQPVITQAGLEALPEAERPRLTPEARKIQIDTRTSEAAAEAISKNLRIGVDQVPADVRMPEGWTIEGDIYIPPVVEAAPAPQPEARESRREAPVEIQQQYTPKTDEEQQSFDRASTNKILARSPQLAVAAVRMKNGEITAGEYADLVDVLDPFVVKGAEPVPTNEKIYQYMSQTAGAKPDSEQGKKKLAKIGAVIPNGKLAEFRIDIPTYNESTKNGDTVYSITGHEPVSETAKSVGETIAHLGIAKITNPQFITRTISGKGDAVQIAMGAGKFPLATVKGNYEAITELPSDINDPNAWTEAGYNPVRSSELVDVRSKQAVVGGTEAIMVGSRVFVKNAQLEARPTGVTMGERYARRAAQTTVGMTTDAVKARLEALGFGVEGMIRIVEDPQAAFEGRTIIQDGKAVRIELNASALNDNAAIDRVLNHEFAEAANADGALNKLVERLTPKEKKEINDAITRLGYEERVRTTEEAARAIETLAAGWKGRGFFERAVARVEAWGSKLGLKLTRRAAEYIAARNLSDINAGFKAAYNRFINVKGEAREGRAFVTPEENARFMELAKDPEANREELQKMVDDAAEKAGFSVFDWWHGTKKDFNTFKATRYDDGLIFFSSKRDFSERWARNRKPNEKILERIESVRKESRDLVENLFKADGRFDLKRERTEDTPEMREAAEKYLEAGREFERSKLDGMTWVEAEREMGVRIIHAYLGANRIFDPSKDWREVLPAILKRFGVKSESEIDKQSMDMLLKGNYIIWEEKALTDAVFEKFEAMMIQEDSDGPMDTIAVRDPSLIKMADPVTYDDQGNVIPLDQRFQPATADIRYARRDYQADADSYKINDLSKIRKVLNLSNIEDSIVKFLSRDLLDAKWAKIPVANDATTHGHCWVAAEAAYHILGGKGKDWEHRTLNNKGWPEGLDAGETHHFIQNKKTGEIIDPTRSQFGNVSIPYGNSIFGGAFMGKTAENPSIRAKALLHRIAAGESRVEIRESRREPAPTFTEESPEAKTLSNLKASMEKVDAASEAKGGKPETQKVSEIAANWMEQGGDERALQDAIIENTNLSPANAAKVAKVIAKQYDKQQQIAEAVLETEAGVTLEGLPEGMEIPKDVDPKNKRTVLQRVIDATTGVRVKPVILQVPEKTALKEQIRLKARETREAKKAQQETADAVVEAIKALELRGPMRAKQAQALAKRAAKVIWTSEKSMENFIAYAERVMANTNYDADLREAKAAQKRAKELSKRDSIAAPQRFVLEAIGNVGINLLNDPREFADVVNHYLRSFKPVVSDAYVVVPDSEMESYLSAAEDEVVSAKAEFEVEDNEKLAEKYGVSVKDLQRFLDAEDIMDALEGYAKREVIEGILNEKSSNVKEALKGVDTTILRADQRKLIDAMNVIDVKSLDSAEKQAYVRIGNNIIFNNNQTNGAEFFVATAKGQQAARDLAKNTEAMTKNRAWANILPSLGSRKAKKLLKSWASELQSIADTFRNAFGKEAMTVFYEAMGMVDLDLGFTQAARTLEEIQEKMAKFYDKLGKKYKGAATNQDGILSEGIVGYLIQNVPAKGEADSLAQRRGLMQQGITNLRKSGDEDKIQMADRIQQLMQRLDGDTVDQMLSNLKREYPANYESLMWLKDDLFPQYKDFLKFSDENFNDQANNYNTPNYLPIVYSNASPALDLLQGKKKYYDNLSSSPKQSSYTIKRSDYTQLPMGSDGRTPKEIGLNLRKNAYNSLSDQITRAYTNPARQRISSFLKTPEAEEALGGKANLDFFADRIERLMGSRERRGSFNEGFFGKAVDVIANLVRDIGTRIALAGSYQLIRQPADQVTVAVGATGRADLMAEHLAPRSIKNARPVIDLFSIGRRGDASSGYKYINQMEGAQSRLERYYTEGNWVKAKEAAKNFSDKFMTPLKVSDFTVAAATWMTFYRAYLAKNGIKFTTWEDAANLIKSDDAGHRRAAAYAENMTDIYQGSSDPTKMAVFAQKGKTGTENLLKSILVPFNSFGIQFRARVSSDITEIFTKSGDWKGKAIAVKDLSATIGGTVMFGLAKRFVLPAITYGGVKILYSIFGVDVEEPDEEKQKEEFEKKWRQLQGDIVSTMAVGGFGQMIEGHAIDGMNYIKYMIDTTNESESVLDDDGEIMSFNEYSKERAPFYRYRSFDNAPSLGMLDIGMDQARKSILNTKMVLTPEEMERFTPEEQRFLYVALVSDWLYLAGFNDADFARMWDKGRRDMINARKEEEKALKKIREGR